MFSSNDHGAASTPGAPQPSGWIWRGNYLPGCWGALPGALGKALGVLGGPVYVEMTLLIAQKPLFGAGQKSHPVPCVCSCLSALLRAQMWSPQAQGGVRPGFQAGWGAKGLGSPCRRPGDRLQASWLLPRPSRRPASPPPPPPSSHLQNICARGGERLPAPAAPQDSSPQMLWFPWPQSSSPGARAQAPELGIHTPTAFPTTVLLGAQTEFLQGQP